MPTPSHEIVITRHIDAPREQVWKLWTEVEHLVHWWGQPKGATMPVFKMDFRVGGTFLYKVEGADGKVVWGKKIYKEIDEPNRLVFNDVYSDEHGNVSSTEGTPDMMITATFEPEGNGTKLTVVHAGIVADANYMEQYNQGWAEVLDRLDEHVANL